MPSFFIVFFVFCILLNLEGDRQRDEERGVGEGKWRDKEGKLIRNGTAKSLKKNPVRVHVGV